MIIITGAVAYQDYKDKNNKKVKRKLKKELSKSNE